jgi:pyrroline-5-carboxylate reductase
MKICIIGFGVMGQALVSALAKSKVVRKISVIKKGSKKPLASLKNFDYVIIAVKPQDISNLAKQVRGFLDESTILISIAAGVSITKIQKEFNHDKVVRVMPNLGLTVSQGIAVWKAGKAVTAKEKSRIAKLLNQLSQNFMVTNEQAIDKATAISGSGPAYFFILAEAILSTAIKLGFNQSQAKQLVSKTFLSAAELQKDSDYSKLIEKIASKKGTTQAAIKVFQQKKFDKLVESAILSAYKRAKELNNV